MFLDSYVALTGVAQNLGDEIFGGLAALYPDIEQVRQIALRTLILQPDGGNSDPIYVGGDANVGAAKYAFRLEGAVTTIPPAPFILGEHETGPMKPKDFWVLGTAGEILHVGIVPF